VKVKFLIQAKIYANADRVLDFLDNKNPAPVLVEFDPSNTCNHGCYFCISSYIHLPESKDLDTYNKTIMPREVLMSACKDFVDMGVRAINWTGGGEPTINKNLKEAIEYISELNEDGNLPRNIKAKLLEIVKILKSAKDTELSLLINKLLSDLDEISGDANLDQFTRQQIWSISSMLEGISN